MFELLLAFIGFFCGIALSFITPEEIKPGKKYFVFAKLVLFLAIVILSLFLFGEGSLVLFSAAYVLLWYIILRKQKPYFQEIANYLFFIVVYFLANDLLILLSSLIFLYGLPAGTLFRLWFRSGKKKRSKDVHKKK